MSVVVDYCEEGHVAAEARHVARGLDQGSHPRVRIRLERIDEHLAGALHTRALDRDDRLLG